MSKITIVQKDFPHWFPEGYKLHFPETKKWLRLAKSVKEVENPCYSRQIGVVIVDPDTNSLVSSGHNGPPQGCPKNDDPEYLRNVVWPQLTLEEQKLMLLAAIPKTTPSFPRELLEGVSSEDLICESFGDKKICPRKLIGAPSGKRLELCTCIHGEVDAITRANRSVSGCYMMCYCGVPCIECTKVIINAGIDTVVGIDHSRGDYSLYSSRWLFEKSKVKLVLVPEDWIWLD
jgi:deoxycytidylate deaminase